jgi:Protein of unknown function (DUF3568)
MRHAMKQFFLIALILGLSIAGISACVPTIAGAGAGFSIAYVAGELQAQEELSIDQAWPATIQALEGLELSVKEQDKDALSAKAIAYGADDKKITVRLRRDSDGVTSFKIRVGLWGDQEFSMTILEKIEEAAGFGKAISTTNKSAPTKGPAPAPREALY